MHKEGGKSLVNRFWIYQKERFPLLSHGTLVAILSVVSILYSALARGDAVGGPAPMAVAFIVGLGFFFQLRVLDEFKDYEDDVAFRSYRPVPRGLVSLRELAMLGLAVGVLQLLLTVWLSSTLWPLLLLVWLYMLLMGKEFFVPAWLKAHPIIYLFSHMVITPLIVLYLTACDWRVVAAAPPPGIGWFLGVGFFNGMVFEIGRKIRAPEDEEQGVDTYSVLWGAAVAVAAWIGVMILAGLCARFAAESIGVADPVTSLAALLLIIAVVVGSRFLRKRVSARARWIEFYSAIWTLVLYIGLGFVPVVLRWQFPT